MLRFCGFYLLHQCRDKSTAWITTVLLAVFSYVIHFGELPCNSGIHPLFLICFWTSWLFFVRKHNRFTYSGFGTQLRFASHLDLEYVPRIHEIWLENGSVLSSMMICLVVRCFQISSLKNGPRWCFLNRVIICCFWETG